MNFTLLKATKIYTISSIIGLTTLCLLILDLFLYFLPDILLEVVRIGLIICTLAALFCKRYNDIGSMKCYLEHVEFFYLNGVNLQLLIKDVKSMRVIIVAYRGGNIGLKVTPHHGGSNVIEFNSNGTITKHYFRIETKAEKESANHLMKKWTLLNPAIKVFNS